MLTHRTSNVLIAAAVIVAPVVIISAAIGAPTIVIRAVFIAPAIVVAAAIVVGVSSVVGGKRIVSPVANAHRGERENDLKRISRHDTGSQQDRCKAGEQEQISDEFHGGCGLRTSSSIWIHESILHLDSG